MPRLCARVPASISWAAGSLYSKYKAAGNSNSVNAGWQMMIAGIVFVLCSLVSGEFGHFSLRHVRKRLLVSVVTTFVGLALLGWLARQAWFYTSLGVPRPSTHAALLLFVLVVPVFTLFVTPLTALWSRRHEFEADAFATCHASAAELASALVKLHRDNASTLTPDTLYAAFYYSHPPPLARITRLRTG